MMIVAFVQRNPYFCYQQKIQLMTRLRKNSIGIVMVKWHKNEGCIKSITIISIQFRPVQVEMCFQPVLLPDACLHQVEVYYEYSKTADKPVVH